MADVKINDLDLASEITDVMQLETDTGGTLPEKITIAQMKAEFQTLAPSGVFIVEPGVGSDVTGDGSLQKPYESYNYAQSQMPPTGFFMMATYGAGVVDQNPSITRDFTYLYAPAIILSPTSGDSLTLNAPGSATTGFLIGGCFPQSGNAINIVSATGTGMQIPIIGGNIVAANGSHQISTLSFQGSLSGNGLVYIDDIGGGSSTSADSATLFGRSKDKWYGSMIFNGRVRNRRSHGIIVPSGLTLSELHAGAKLYTDSTSSMDITLPEEADLVLPDYWQCHINRFNTGAVNFVPRGSDILVGPTSIATRGETYTATCMQTVSSVRTWLIEH